MKTIAEYTELNVPSWALSYIVNGDSSGIDETDQRQVNKWWAQFCDIAAKTPGAHAVFACGDGECYFTSNTEFGLPGDCVECSVLVLAPGEDCDRSPEMVRGFFCGLRGLEIEMTVEQAESCAHAGSCDGDVAALLTVPAIANQLDAIPQAEIRAALKECGAWDTEELADDEANRARALWIACCDAKENLP